MPCDSVFTAKVGLSGVNVAVAETGTLVLVENEGNGRLTTSAPEMHIAITGIEKVVEKLSDVPPILSLLTRSATGQPITTYVNMISSPRKAGEKDGPQQVHLVLLDNGRSQAYADLQLRETLQCIRCGACMNHCPVYTRIGGHAYGTTYPGPIGKIISPHLLGLDDTKDLPSASTLCGACSEVCPVRIPIPELLLRLRQESVTPKTNLITLTQYADKVRNTAPPKNGCGAVGHVSIANPRCTAPAVLPPPVYAVCYHTMSVHGQSPVQNHNPQQNHYTSWLRNIKPHRGISHDRENPYFISSACRAFSTKSCAECRGLRRRTTTVAL